MYPIKKDGRGIYHKEQRPHSRHTLKYYYRNTFFCFVFIKWTNIPGFLLPVIQASLNSLQQVIFYFLCLFHFFTCCFWMENNARFEIAKLACYQNIIIVWYLLLCWSCPWATCTLIPLVLLSTTPTGAKDPNCFYVCSYATGRVQGRWRSCDHPEITRLRNVWTTLQLYSSVTYIVVCFR